MENPFKKFFHEDSELAPPRRMEPEEKAKRLAELKEWKRQE